MQFPNFDRFASLAESLAGRLSFFDNTFRLIDNSDQTKKVAFQLSGLTTATERTLTVPDASFTLGKTLVAGSATAGTWPLIQSGTVLTTAEAGALEYDGNVLYFSPAASSRGLVPAHYYARIDAARNLVDDTSTQTLFPSTEDVLTVVAGGTYRFRLVARLTKGANNVSMAYITTLATATLTSINAVAISGAAASGTAVAANINNIDVATTITVVAASTGANIRLQIEGEFEVGTGGTLSPTVAFSGATGSTPTVNVGTFFECWRVGANPITAIGPFA